METVLITLICAWAAVAIIRTICLAVLVSQKVSNEREHVEIIEGGIPPVANDNAKGSK